MSCFRASFVHPVVSTTYVLFGLLCRSSTKSFLVNISSHMWSLFLKILVDYGKSSMTYDVIRIYLLCFAHILRWSWNFFGVMFRCLELLYSQMWENFIRLFQLSTLILSTYTQGGIMTTTILFRYIEDTITKKTQNHVINIKIDPKIK